MGQYLETMRRTDGAIIKVTPMSIGDLGDNENNYELCLDVVGEPLSVSFTAGFLTDPNEDLNPYTEMAVTPAKAD